MAKLYINILVIFSLSTMLIHPLSALTTTTYNLLKLGAKPDGVTDTTEYFLSAWEAACDTIGPALIIVPTGRYLIHPITFNGVDCQNNEITFLVSGTLWAPPHFRALGDAPNWIGFDRVTGVSFIGDGTLDAKGSALWDCKLAGDGRKCPDGATTLSFTNSNNIVIKGITSLNSQMFHIVINYSNNVYLEAVKIRAPGNSPNTDGIHVQLSTDVTIMNSIVKTGDDCISIGPGTRNLWIERVACGPSHGISIGSLARDMEEEGVQNVTAKTIVLSHSTNGVRIKSWGRPSEGFVQGVRFQDVLMREVWNPIIIDQNYCPHNLNCPNQDSGVDISDVVYENIRGTSTSEVAVKFDCSPSNPCTGIKMQNVNLTYRNQTAKSFCKNAAGMVSGLVNPESCF